MEIKWIKSEKSTGNINNICNVLYFLLGNEYSRFVSFSLFNIVLLISSSFNESLFFVLFSKLYIYIKLFLCIYDTFFNRRVLRRVIEGIGASLVAQRIKHLPAMRETRIRSLGWEDPLEKGMATHSSILAWRIPWTEEPGGLQSTGSQRVGHE